MYVHVVHINLPIAIYNYVLISWQQLIYIYNCCDSVFRVANST